MRTTHARLIAQNLYMEKIAQADKRRARTVELPRSSGKISISSLHLYTTASNKACGVVGENRAQRQQKRRWVAREVMMKSVLRIGASQQQIASRAHQDNSPAHTALEIRGTADANQRQPHPALSGMLTQRQQQPTKDQRRAAAAVVIRTGISPSQVKALRCLHCTQKHLSPSALKFIHIQEHICT
jgi:hypothetical protein